MNRSKGKVHRRVGELLTYTPGQRIDHVVGNDTTNQVTPGGNYTTGGASVANPTVTLSGGAGVFDGDDVSIAQHASNPTNARWGVLYSDTATNKNCLGYVDLGTTINLSAGAFSITWNASGITSMNQA